MTMKNKIDISYLSTGLIKSDSFPNNKVRHSIGLCKDLLAYSIVTINYVALNYEKNIIAIH